MARSNGRTVSRRPNGSWANTRNGASRAGSLHDTQSAAQKAARQMLKNEGGGELTTKGTNGKIREKDTVAPGNDPHPPKG